MTDQRDPALAQVPKPPSPIKPQRYRSKRSVLAFALPLLAMTFLCFMGVRLALRAEPPRLEPTLPPAQTRFATQIAGIGVIEPQSEIISIGTHVPGVIDQVHVKAGDTVRVGDPLFAIDTREALAVRESARARVQIADVALADAQRQYGFQEKIADKGAVSQREKSLREFAVKRAEAERASALAALGEIETLIIRSTVRAPIDGTILKMNVRLGEYASTGTVRDPLVTLGDLAVAHVRVEIDETDAQRLKTANAAEGYLRSRGDKPIPLTFVRLEPLLVPKRSLTGDGNERVDTRVLEVIYSFDNTRTQAYIGQQMDVFIKK